MKSIPLMITYLQRQRAINSLGFEEYRHFPHVYLQRALKDTTQLLYEGIVPFRDGKAHAIKTTWRS